MERRNFDPSELREPPVVNDTEPTTLISVQTFEAGRRDIRINLTSTVSDLAAHVVPYAVDRESKFCLNDWISTSTVDGSQSNY
jgi:hypothetical protein